MKAILAVSLIVLFVISSCGGAYAGNTRMPQGEWVKHKSTHFIIYYHPDIPRNYVRQFAYKCEKYYDRITHRFGFNRFDFWLWEDRARVFIYYDRESYLGSTGRAEWSGASVQVKDKIISTFYFDTDFFDAILPHELGHIILREFIGLKVGVPLWFDEGVACANEKGSLQKYFLSLKEYVDKHKHSRGGELDGVVKGEIIAPEIFYPASASMVMFLLEEYGSSRFVKFCKMIRDKYTFEAAMEKAYNVSGAAELNRRFSIYLDKKTYEDIKSGKSFKMRWG